MKTVYKLTYSMVLVFCTIWTLSAQQNTTDKALESIKTLYKDRVETVMATLENMSTQDTNVAKGNVDVDGLYKAISERYKNTFTAAELEQLFTFYKTEVGKKWLANQSILESDVSLLISNTEMKFLGIEETVPIEDSAETLDSEANSQVINSEVGVPTAVTPLPKIETLEALRTYLKQNPFAISDIDLLQAIFGPDVDIDKLLTPGIQGEEDTPKTQTSKN
jgi:hypothetical protein